MKTERVRQWQLALLPLLLIASTVAFPLAAQAEPLLSPAASPLRAETVVRNIEAPSDDADQGVYPGNLNPANLNGEILTVGGAPLSHAGLRFTNITIPQGATIQEAHLVLTIMGGSFATLPVTVRGHAVADSPPFSPSDGPLTRYDQKTTPWVLWPMVGSTTPTIASSPDLSILVQEIISQPDWTSGNALSLMLYDFYTADLAVPFAAWEDPEHAPAQLVITYTEPPPTTGGIDPNMYFNQEFQILGNPDLVVTHVGTDQNGYRANDPYTVTVEVKNLGAADSGPFDIVGQIGRYYNGGVTLTWGLGPDLILGAASFPIASVSNLAPGEIFFIETDPRSLGSDVFPDSIEPSETPQCCWVENLPNWGQVFLKVSATAPETEYFTTNNAATTWFIYPNLPEGTPYDIDQDQDGDGFFPPEDCDDTNSAIHPYAEEIPGDGADNDCDGDRLEDLGDWFTLGPDLDRDQDGWTPNEGDCSDTDADIHPGMSELDNGLDDDCDGLVDEGFDSVDPDAQDADGDGWTVGDGDCDDLQGGVNPDAYEIPDGIDNDCDTFIDEGFLTPDWTVELTLERRDADCQYRPHQEGYIDYESPLAPLCGIQATYIVGNEGESLGSTQGISDQVRLLDLAGREFSAFTPYIDFPSQAYAEYMACDAAGLIASVPGGLMGEENTSNNWAIGTLPQQERNLDIVQNYLELGYSMGNLSISLTGDIEGSCPPPTFFWGYPTGVSIFVDGELKYEVAEETDIADHVSYVFQDRPRNNAEIEIRVLLNSDERFDENADNNLCVINVTYDRNSQGFWNWVNRNVFGGGLPATINDSLNLDSAQGCDVAYTTEERIMLGSNSLSIGWTFVLELVVLLGVGLAGGGLLARRIVQRAGIAGVGQVLSTIAGALVGPVALAGIAMGIVALVETRGAETSMPQMDIHPRSDDVTGLLLAADNPQVVSCEDLVASSMEAIMTDAGALEDVLLSLQPVEGVDLPNGHSFRVTLWDGRGDPLAMLTTEETSLSLALEGLLPEIGATLFWQSVVQAPLPGGDLQIPLCLPMVQTFVVDLEPEDASTTRAAEPAVTVTPATPDTSPPSVKSTNAVPNPALTTTPVTVSANITDQTGIAGVDLYYRMGKGAIQYGGAMLHHGGAVYSLQIGPLVPAGTYNYYILAEDTLGNANCTVATVETCPAGSFIVIIP